jgi:hypothetical protein
MSKTRNTLQFTSVYSPRLHDCLEVLWEPTKYVNIGFSATNAEWVCYMHLLKQ